MRIKTNTENHYLYKNCIDPLILSAEVSAHFTAALEKETRGNSTTTYLTLTPSPRPSTSLSLSQQGIFITTEHGVGIVGIFEYGIGNGWYDTIYPILKTKHCLDADIDFVPLLFLIRDLCHASYNSHKWYHTLSNLQKDLIEAKVVHKEHLVSQLEEIIIEEVPSEWREYDKIFSTYANHPADKFILVD